MSLYRVTEELSGWFEGTPYLLKVVLLVKPEDGQTLHGAIVKRNRAYLGSLNLTDMLRGYRGYEIQLVEELRNDK